MLIPFGGQNVEQQLKCTIVFICDLMIVGVCNIMFIDIQLLVRDLFQEQVSKK